MIRVAILGAGHIAESMAKALLGLKDRGVVSFAVASRSKEKAADFAAKWGFEKSYGSYEELAADEEVDLVYIATPHSHHYEHAMLCLSHGRNCLVEKAFCANSGQTERLLTYAREHKLLLAEAMWTRYQPSFPIIAEALSSGIIGNLRTVESDFSLSLTGIDRLCNPNLAGGALLDLGIYSISVPAMYIDGEPKTVAVDVTKYETGVDATDCITMTYDNGITATCRCSFAAKESANYAKLIGDKGYLIFSSINSPQQMDIFDLEGNLLRHHDFVDEINGYEYEVLACKDAIEQGLPETPSMPHSEILRMMRRMDHLRRLMDVTYPFENEEDIFKLS